MNSICFIGGLPGVGKTTLAEKLELLGPNLHIDTDKVAKELVSDNERLLKNLFQKIPEKILNDIKSSENPQKLFQEIFKLGGFTPYINKIVFEISLNQAIRLKKKKKKNILISGLLIDKNSRNLIKEILDKKGIDPILIYIKSDIKDILNIAKNREQNSSSNLIFNKKNQKEVLQLLGEVEEYEHNEGWKYVELYKKKITDITKRYELQFLLN